ncbi:hypothetical protein AGMMS49942_30040 [Spirochaetia bacterium]|nr:hypothetical protein AGMMS49942_30040 [Spirochaetia bacterium]
MLTITGPVDVADVFITPKAGAVVSLRGGGTLERSTGTDDALFELSEANSTLILRDAVLKGHVGNDNPLVRVNMESSVKFVMYGGTITGNTGGGVFVNDGTFTMSGGTISGNTASNLGGGVAVGVDTFTKTGGTISGNTAGEGKEVVWMDEDSNIWIVNEPVTGPLSTDVPGTGWVALPPSS